MVFQCSGIVDNTDIKLDIKLNKNITTSWQSSQIVVIFLFRKTYPYFTSAGLVMRRQVSVPTEFVLYLRSENFRDVLGADVEC